MKADFRAGGVNRFALAGAAVVTASAMAVAPVTVTPTVPALPEFSASTELSAFQNPLTLWATTISNTLTTTGGLGTNIIAQHTALGDTLGDPAIRAEFLQSLVGTIGNPVAILREALAFPSTYGDRIKAALAASSGASGDALSKLPAVLQTSLGHLLRGEFLLAFGELNYWFLTDGLSDGRGALLDALRIPGDFLESIGLDPLARILGTSWMDEGTNGPGYGPGLLSRGMIGNLGRALLAPAVTAIFQTVEILDKARAALFSGDLVTLASEVINAPAKIVNAFLNGYVPDFVTDPDSPYPPGPGQSFPGLLSPTGTFDFFFVQIPQQIVRALNMEKPAPAATAAFAGVSDASVGEGSDTVTLDLVSSETGTAPEGDGGAPAVVDEIDELPAEEPADVDEVEEVDEVEVSDEVDEVEISDEVEESDAAEESDESSDDDSTDDSAGGDDSDSDAGESTSRTSSKPSAGDE